MKHGVLYIWWLDVKSLPGKIKRCVWNKHILFWWYRLWIRKDELHRSLDIDGEAIHEMKKEELEKYLADNLRRRGIAYRRN